MERRGHIYLITNTETKKMYVGQTVCFRRSGNKLVPFGYLKRFEEHIHSTTKKLVSVLGKDIVRYGRNAFIVELLEECDVEDLDTRERHWIDTHNTMYPNGYNILYGAPYVMNEIARSKVSSSLTAFFANIEVRQMYSALHKNNFKPLSSFNIQGIEVHPIKQNGEYKIVYMYIHYHDAPHQRRRYGGIHEPFDEALERCCADAMNIMHGDVSKIHLDNSRVQKAQEVLKDRVVQTINLTIHTMGSNRLVSANVKHTDMNGDDVLKKRYVFGGKTVDIESAYQSAIEFATKISTDNTVIQISKSLSTARHSNCSGTP
jgi:group I intron endonuclease